MPIKEKAIRKLLGNKTDKTQNPVGMKDKKLTEESEKFAKCDKINSIWILNSSQGTNFCAKIDVLSFAFYLHSSNPPTPLIFSPSLKPAQKLKKRKGAKERESKI